LAKTIAESRIEVVPVDSSPAELSQLIQRHLSAADA
jgi:hypothetical protein